MSGRNAREAVVNFITPLQRAVSCLTQLPLATAPGGKHVPNKVHSLMLAAGSVLHLQADTSRIQLELTMQYEAVPTDDRDRGPWKVRTHGYIYTVSTPDSAVVAAWHWHPTSRIDTPHLHLGHSTLRPEAVVTGKHHLPTERISMESVIRFCIAELGVAPRRKNWEQVLADSEDLFKLWRTWR